MPKVTWKLITPELRNEEWLKDFNESIESRRRKGKPSYEAIADAAQISRQALAYKLKTGCFTFKEFAGIADFLRFSDAEILRLVKSYVPDFGTKDYMKASEVKHGYVYFISNNQGAVKVGQATNVEKRLSDIQISNPQKLMVLASIQYDKSKLSQAEVKWQNLFDEKSSRLNGEWFQISDKNAIEIIRENIQEKETKCLKFYSEEVSLKP